MKLAAALDMTGDEVVPFVGGGGKTTAMFRLAREMVEKGGQPELELLADAFEKAKQRHG